MPTTTNPPAKPYELAFEERPEYLYAVVRSDTMQRDTALAYLTEIADKCAQLGCKRLLIERDVPVMLPDGDLFFVTNAFLELIKGRIVAVVNPHATLQDDMQFAITIGTNRGGNYKLFDNVPAAEKWLLRLA